MSHLVDELRMALSTAPSRRTVMRGLAGAVGTVGLATTFGAAPDADAKKNNNNKKKRRRKKKNQQCSNNKPCEAFLNPCEVVSCKKHKCVTSNAADGTDCGDGLVCETGACVCPNGLCTVFVSAPQQEGWVGVLNTASVDFEVENSILTFVDGPAVPIYGTGSVQLSVSQDVGPLDVNNQYVTNYFFQGVFLTDITQLQYSTYQPSTNPGATDFTSTLQINVDFFGPGSNPTGLIQYNPAPNGYPVIQNTWQEWDAIEANGAAEWTFDGAEWPDSNIPGSTARTWAQILSAYPNARIDTNDAFVGLFVANGTVSSTLQENIGSFTFGVYGGVTRYVFSQDAV